MHESTAPEPAEAKPAPRRTGKQWTTALLRDLLNWSARKPIPLSEEQQPIAHSSDVRMVVWAFVGTDLVTGILVDTMVPPVGRVIHLLWILFSLVFSLGFCAMTARAPHLLDASELHLRTGPFRDLTIPVEALESVRVAHSSSHGHGLRRVPDEDDAVACTVGSATNLVIDLREPLLVELRKGEPVLAKRIRTVADEPAAAARLISGAITRGVQR
ncbi:hypothetical protein [Streptomyces cellulosae]|uniref:hypothetical protein n=1 Tax=Streptomyces cellulosae TaxID=1968 RepID=UPI00131C636A|nr:hypothetical protein [Streptomyces cellulosae]